MALIVSTFLGLLWHAAAIMLMGGGARELVAPKLFVAGLLAGLLAGVFTVWSRRRRAGRESVLYGLMTFYLGMLVYWFVFVLLARIELCVQHGGWTKFNLHDHLGLIIIFVFYGTIWFGLFLIPSAFASRWIVWRVYEASHKQ